jgi:hypothetical protein
MQMKMSGAALHFNQELRQAPDLLNPGLPKGRLASRPYNKS